MVNDETPVEVYLIAQQIETHFICIEKLLPPSYKISLLARCTNKDLADADLLMTRDDLAEIKKAIIKRENAILETKFKAQV